MNVPIRKNTKLIAMQAPFALTPNLHLHAVADQDSPMYLTVTVSYPVVDALSVGSKCIKLSFVKSILVSFFSY